MKKIKLKAGASLLLRFTFVMQHSFSFLMTITTTAMLFELCTAHLNQ